ncbi:MAG: hypothetical protein EOP42_13955 [Sphingobacteriaceae bacterium]|nr:MAG: hypothetical protein EOP42_13955 [Sphingobacteriaceae bacterium]
MVKKWLHIFLCVWLINSITFPQIGNIPQFGHQCSNNAELNIDSWTDFVLESFAADKSLSSDTKHHTKYHRRYVHVNAHQFNDYLAVKHLLYLPYDYSKKVVKKSISPYLIGIALLPAYYNFLFRLSPF